MTSNAYEDVQRSLLAFCKNFLTRNSITGFEVFDFDSHASEQELPDNDLIGIAEYTIENKKDLYHVTCMVAVCTKSDDAQLKRLRPVVGHLFRELVPGTQNETTIIVDSNNIKRGYFTVMDDVFVGPIATTKTRPFQVIGLSLAVGYLQLPI